MSDLVVDGARFSGSGSIVRLAAAYAAVTGTPISVVNARAVRRPPGLRRQHAMALRAVHELVGGTLEGADVGSDHFTFRPGDRLPRASHRWDIGSAGSVTALSLALVPVLIARGGGVTVELVGGLFQDYAPTVFHLQHALVPALARMGADVEVEMLRPGYVPSGEGILRLHVAKRSGALRPLTLSERGPAERTWGVAMASHLAQRDVAGRIARAAHAALADAGSHADIEVRDDRLAAQPGAAFALFADFAGGVRLGADCAGAPRRPAEHIGRHVATELLDVVASGATVDRFLADQLVVFAAMADGVSTFVAPRVTGHVESAAWLAQTLLADRVEIDADAGVVTVSSAGIRP